MQSQKKLLQGNNNIVSTTTIDIKAHGHSKTFADEENRLS